MTKRLILFGPLPPPYGGVSVFVKSLFAHLKDYPVNLWAIFGENTKDPRVTRFNHRRLGVVKALTKEGRDSRIIDFTHFHLEYPHPILLPLWLTAKSMLGFEWFKYILDGSLPRRYPNFTTQQTQLFKQALNSVDQFIVVSGQLRDWLKNELNVTAEITVIPCLLNIPDEVQSTPMSATTEAALSTFMKHNKRVCSIGAFIPAYGFHDVARAIEKLRNESGDDIGLLLLDGSFASDAGYRAKVLDNRDWISVLTNVANPEVYQILRRCDLMVRATEAEGYGICRVEAIWCGVPVIGSNAGETRGVRVYEFGDEAQLSRLIREMLAMQASETISEWAKVFRVEADANLERFIEVVGLEKLTTEAQRHRD